MAKKLGGSTFVWNGIKQDYCFKETIICLAELCDEVSVMYGGDDGTEQEVHTLMCSLADKYENKVFIWSKISQELWDSQQGREKLSFFSNLAMDNFTPSVEWNFYLQCDEMLHEDSFQMIRMAIEHDTEAFFCIRYNLWKDAYHILNVPQERKPCSTEVIRLAKKAYRCFDDAESLGVPSVSIFGAVESIEIFHMGFVRDPVKHLEKIRHMQTEVFLWGDFDEKAKNCDRLEPDRWFDPEKDLIPIHKPLPKYIQQWAADRWGLPK